MAYLIAAYAVSLLGAAAYTAHLIRERRRVLRRLAGPGGARGGKVPRRA